MLATPWNSLQIELDAWRAAGREPTFWLRDDDATEASLRLDWLLEQCNEFRVPLALAVIPALLKPSLVERLQNEKCVTVVQHGFRHHNYGEGEFGSQRTAEVMLSELAHGREILEKAFGEKFFPVLVPPWNRIDSLLIPKLGSVGLVGVSTAHLRASGAENEVRIANIHCDIMKWKPSPHCRGEIKNINDFVAHLSARRLETSDPSEHTGFLAHHLAHDEAADLFTRDFFRFTTAGGARWLTVEEVFRG